MKKDSPMSEKNHETGLGNFRTKNCATCGEPLAAQIGLSKSQRCRECIPMYGQESTRWFPENTIPVVDEDRLS